MQEIKIKKINKISNYCKYDITVPSTNNFFANGILIHNSNGGISYNNVDGIWFQSRENIISVLKDNAGFAFFAEANKQHILKLIEKFSLENDINLDENTISIYFEWVGKGIQKGVSISEIEKSAFVIGIKISPFDENKVAYWVDSKSFKNEDIRIFNIEDFKTYEIEIDFNNPLLSQNTIIDYTLEVENECPVGKHFGIRGIGEGIVFNHFTEDGQRYMFKSKGELHSKSSKVTTLKEVDDEKLNKVIVLVNNLCPNWRLEQMLEKTFDLMNGGELDVRKTGEFIKNMMQDILKEELDIISENGLTPKDISGKVADISKKFLFEKLNENLL